MSIYSSFDHLLNAFYVPATADLASHCGRQQIIITEWPLPQDLKCVLKALGSHQRIVKRPCGDGIRAAF